MLWLRPFMDKRTNSFNISISAVTFINFFLLFFFSNLSGISPIVTGVMGIVFFIVNAIFAFVSMILVVISVAYAIFSEYPESRYPLIQDERVSFIKPFDQ